MKLIVFLVLYGEASMMQTAACSSTIAWNDDEHKTRKSPANGPTLWASRARLMRSWKSI